MKEAPRESGCDEAFAIDGNSPTEDVSGGAGDARARVGERSHDCVAKGGKVELQDRTKRCEPNAGTSVPEKRRQFSCVCRGPRFPEPLYRSDELGAFGAANSAAVESGRVESLVRSQKPAGCAANVRVRIEKQSLFSGPLPPLGTGSPESPTRSIEPRASGCQASLPERS